MRDNIMTLDGRTREGVKGHRRYGLNRFHELFILFLRLFLFLVFFCSLFGLLLLMRARYVPVTQIRTGIELRLHHTFSHDSS